MSLNHILTPHVSKKLVLGTVFEFGPVILFILSFRFLHIYKATLVLMVLTIVSTVLTYKIQKRLPYLALYVALLTSIFGYMTLFNHNPKFIQMKDTLYDVTCAMTLIAGLILNISFLKIAFNSVFPTTDNAWDKLTYAWILFFITNAGFNEYVRRTMSLKQWFGFKSVMVILTIVFGLTTLILFYEEKEKRHKKIS